MRSILFLLILSLMKGCESQPKEWDGSKNSKVPGSTKAYLRPTDIQSTKKDKWENKDSISLYYDRINKKLTMEINQYKSTCTSDGAELELIVEKDDCLGPFNQIAYKTTISCDYPGGKNGSSMQFFCQDNMLICEDILSNSSSESNRKFTLTNTSSGFNISISNVSESGADVHWCGEKTSECCRVALRSKKLKDEDGLHMLITVTVSVFVVLLLLFVLILILIYKRFSHSKNTRNGATAQNIKEDYIYEEIQERVQNPDSGDAMNTVYATANFPTNPSASLDYSTVAFKNCSNEAGGDELMVKLRSACDYSTVKHSESPVYSTVNKPSRSSQDPLYSTVTNKY